MPYLHLIDEAIGLLNTEIRLIEWCIKYPEQLKQRIEKQSLSPLYLADKTALINIMEMVSGPLQRHCLSERQTCLFGRFIQRF